MNRFVLLFFFLILPLAAETPKEPGPQLYPGKNDAEWLSLFGALGSRRVVVAEFSEQRWFPFKKIPVVLKGVMRLAPDLGMSLNYTEPEQRTIIIDARGLILREADGREREIPSDPAALAAASAMLPILNFDWQKLDRNFLVYAARDGEDWRLDFVPRDSQLASRLGRIVASGQGVLMRHLEFRRSALQRVEILIGETKQGGSFTPEEKKRYFR